MSLTTCLKKAGAALNADDKAAIVARARAIRGEGFTADEAAIKAVQEQLDAVRAQIAAEPPAGGENTAFTKDALEAARERIRKNLGRLNSGLDPQDMIDAVTIAGYHIERGARSFAAFAKAMIADLGDAIKPYLRSLYMSVRYDPRAVEFSTQMDTATTMEAVDLDKLEETDDAQHSGPGVEPDSTDGAQPDLEAPVRSGSSGSGGGRGGNRSSTRSQGGAADHPSVLPGTRANADGAERDSPVHSDEPAVPGGVPGDSVDERGDPVGGEGPSPESLGDKATEDAARRATADTATRLKQQRAAESLPVDVNDPESIRASLPLLLPEQQDDVIFALDRFKKPEGYGIVFTNGTGTGKTFSGLGIAKILSKQGKNSILVVAPNAEVMAGWLKSGPMLGLKVTQLRNTKDHGTGIVVTTYANLKDNDSLVKRKWDMVMADEAQNLSANAEGDETDALNMVRAITMHPAGVERRTQALHPELHGQIMELNKQYRAAVKAKSEASMRALDMRMRPLLDQWGQYRRAVSDDIAEAQGADRPRLTMLSATPFAYAESVRMAQGYLFDWSAGFDENHDRLSPYAQFMVRHFGYRIRYGKLTKPDPKKVDQGLMERQFNTWLRKEGVLSGRMLDVNADYDRKFVAAHSEIGSRIDRAFEWFNETEAKDLPGLPVKESKDGEHVPDYEQQVNRAKWNVRTLLHNKFDYRTRLRLLEALKAKAAIPYIRESLARGRKVVVFHDLIKGQTLDPFNLRLEGEDNVLERAIRDRWAEEFSDLVGFDFKSLKTPIETLSEAFGDKAMMLNGQTVTKKQGLENIAALNDDTREPMILVVQSDKEAGWSGHDTTGKYPRVIVNLGLPVRPTRSIQQEGRIYRVGQMTDAMFRYLNTQTAWEQSAFAHTMARRASTAENLAMGEQARGLLDAYIESFEDTDEWAPGFDGEGTGGKARDREMAAIISEYDRAKTLYYAQLAKRKQDKGQEGVDYFATPEPVGLKMVQWADLRPGESAMEPSAGHGAIARWLPDNVDRLAVEPSPRLSAKLALAFDGNIKPHRFEDLHTVNKADAIVMNPPFGVGGKTAIEHLGKAYNEHLTVGGRIVILLPEGPAADARFDKWLNGSSERAAKPIGDLAGPGGIIKDEIYVGDTIKSKFLDGGGTVTAVRDGKVYAKAPGATHATGYQPSMIDGLARTGPRKVQQDNAPGARIVATIRLPASTFERAATGVRTRVVVIDKLAPDQEPAPTIDRNLSELKSNDELFDELEDMSVPERTKPRPADVEEGGAAVNEGPKEKREASKDGDKAAESAGYNVIEYRTRAGKLLRVIEAPHLTRAQAEDVEGAAWKPSGAAGFYIKTKNVPAMLAKYPPPASLQDIGRAPQTETAAFKRWFGDSKVVDAEGKPLVVYHGTDSDFATFNVGRGDLGKGIYFASAADDAASYASLDGRGANVMPVYVSIQNPYYWTKEDRNKSADAVNAAARRAGHDGIIRTWAASDEKHIIAFRPEQIKSAIGNSGTFDTTNQNILQDLSTLGERIAQMGYERQSPERIQAARQLTGLIARLDAGEISQGYFESSVRLLAGRMDRIVTTKAANRIMRDRQRGADIVREKLIAARRRSDLDNETVELALWLLDRNPGLADDLAITVRRSPYEQDSEVTGDYNPTSRVIRLFKSRIGEDTAAHELLHHTERMMPEDMQAAIRREWAAALAETIKKATPAQLAALRGIPLSMAGEAAAHRDLLRAFGDGVLNYDEHYALVNPSEFWAVNATRILRGEFDARGSIWARIKQWVGELFQKLKGLFGMRSDAPVLHAIDYLLDTGNFGPERGGTFASKNMLRDGPVDATLQNIAPSLPAQPPAGLKPSTAPLDNALRLTAGQVSRWSAPAYSKALDVADRALSVFGDYYEYAKAGLVDQYGVNPEHSEAKTAMKTAIRVNARKTKELIDKLRALDGAQSRIAYLWLGDKAEDTAAERALFDDLPEEAQALLQSLKADIEHLSDEAVELGLISPEVRERHANAYLHRSYLKYEAALVQAEGRFAGTRAASLVGEQFKGRGMRGDASMSEVGTADWWQRKTNGSAHDPSLKGKKFHRLERRKLPDTQTPQMIDGEQNERLGKLKQVVYWPVDEAIPRHFADWRNDGTWEARWFNKRDKVGMFRDFTLAERTALGEIQEVKYAVATTMMQAVRDVEMARFLDWVARNESLLDESQLPEGAKLLEGASARMSRSFLKSEWVRVPDNKIPGTDVKRFGNLGGRYVPGPVWNDIRQVQSFSDRGDLTRLRDVVMKIWKVAKTSMSPITHMNNVMSNFIMADAHDIQARHVYGALKAWAKHKSDPESAKLLDDYRDHGGDAGMFNENEVKQELFGPLLDDLRAEVEAGTDTALVTAAQVMDLFSQRKIRQAFAALGKTRRVKQVSLAVTGGAIGAAYGGPVGAAAGAAYGAALPWLAPKLMKLYATEDEVFRLAAFIKAREDGLSDDAAGKFARDSFLNYEINAPWVNAMRRSWLPFIAFQYRAVPMMARMGAEKPHKALKYWLLGAAVSAIAYSMLGDAGDEDKERAMLPDEKSGKIWGLFPKLVRLWNDTNGAPVFLDIRRWIPAGDFADIGQSHAALPIPPILNPGGPQLSMLEFALNTSGFTGNDLILESDTMAERFEKSADFFWKAMAPNMPGLPGTYSTQSIVDAARGKVSAGPFGSEQSSLAQAVVNSVGIKIRSYPMDSLTFNEQAKQSAMQREILTTLSKEVKKVNRYSSWTQEQKDAEVKKLREAAMEKITDRRGDLMEKKKAAGLVQ